MCLDADFELGFLVEGELDQREGGYLVGLDGVLFSKYMVDYMVKHVHTD